MTLIKFHQHLDNMSTPITVTSAVVTAIHCSVISTVTPTIDGNTTFDVANTCSDGSAYVRARARKFVRALSSPGDTR